MNKNRHIIGELQEFFANNDASKAINSISTIMNSIRIQSKVIGSVKNPNCKFTCLQVLQLLVLFPFFFGIRMKNSRIIRRRVVSS